jgi:hypothetical protein
MQTTYFRGSEQMAFLQPDVLPAMAEAIHRQLAAARGARLAQESLAAAVVPEGLSKGAGGEKYFSDTLRELAGIGVVVLEDGQVALPADAPAVRQPGSMHALVRTKLMTAERGADLWEKDELGSLVLLGARDLVRAFAWFLSLDVAQAPYAYARGSQPLERLQEDHTGELLILNPTRWLPFVRWGRYLGFLSDVSFYSGAGRSEPAVIPDPTIAVRAVLPRCVRTGEWAPLTALIPALANELPVLDRGLYRRAIHEHGAPEPDADCSPSLTLAFERLRACGEIELEVGAGDAEKVVFANNRGAFHALRLVATP